MPPRSRHEPPKNSRRRASSTSSSEIQQPVREGVGGDGAGRNPQLVAWIEMALAVISQTAVRRSVTARPLVTDLWRLHGFFLGIGGGMLTRSAKGKLSGSTTGYSRPRPGSGLVAIWPAAKPP
jgi:hypothetical protein